MDWAVADPVPVRRSLPHGHTDTFAVRVGALSAEVVDADEARELIHLACHTHDGAAFTAFYAALAAAQRFL